MKNADAYAEFHVDILAHDGSISSVSGWNYEKDVFVGDVFSWIYRVTIHKTGEHEFSYEYSDERPIALQIVSVEFARKTTDRQGNQLNVLGHGSTGRLQLTGSGGDQLKPPGKLPVSYDLLRVERRSLGH